MSGEAHCIFCFKHPADAAPTCSYGFHHEFPELPREPVVKVKVRDAKLCVKCGLHPKNPVAATNGCEHAYEAS